MSGIKDGNRPNEGVEPYQHHGHEEDGYDTHSRATAFGVRITGRRNAEGELGEYEEDPEARGDMHGKFHWPTAEVADPVSGKGVRRVGTIRHAMPGVVTGPGGTSEGDDDQGGAEGGSGPDRPFGEVPPNSRTPWGATILNGAVLGFTPFPGFEGAPNPLGGSFSWPTFDLTPGANNGVDPNGQGTTFSGNQASHDNGGGGGGAGGGGGGGGPGGPTTGESPAPDRRYRPATSSYAPPPTQILPTQGLERHPDRRFRPLVAGYPRAADNSSSWPAFPNGFHVVTFASQDENEQIEYPCPIDPRLIVTHHNGSQAFNTLIADLGSGDHINHRRMGPLHTLARVVRRPDGELGLQGNRSNSLAWTIGLTGQSDAWGGFVASQVFPGDARFAHVDVANGGPFDVGHRADKHQIGNTDDEDPINPLHFSSLTFWQSKVAEHDGPMCFDDSEWIDPSPGTYLVPVHFRYKPQQRYEWPRDRPTKQDQGMWCWVAEIPIGAGGGGGTPTGDTPPTTKDPDDPTRQPDPDGGGGPPTGNPGRGAPPFGIQLPGNSASLTPRDTAWTHLPLGTIADLARPQLIGTGLPDLTTQMRPDADGLRRWTHEGPIAARREAWGAQNNGTFDYTQLPGQSVHRGGTVAGGWITLPPGVTMADRDQDFAPPGVTVPQTWEGVAPGVRMFSGIPQEDGTVRDGWSWEVDGSGNLVFYSHDSAGAETARFTLTSSPAAYTPSNVTTLRSYDADSTSTAELADVLGTLIGDLQALGLLA